MKERRERERERERETESERERQRETAVRQTRHNKFDVLTRRQPAVDFIVPTCFCQNLGIWKSCETFALGLCRVEPVARIARRAHRCPVRRARGAVLSRAIPTVRVNRLVVCIARRAHRRAVRRARGAVLSRAITADADVLLALDLC